MDLSDTDWGRLAKNLAQLDRLNWAHFREAMLQGKDAWAPERELAAKLATGFPELPRMFRRVEDFQVEAVSRLALDARLAQWIHCGPGYPSTAGSNDTHHLVLDGHPRRKVLYVTDDLIIATHSRALRAHARPDQVRVINGDIFQPGEIANHPDVDGWIDWNQPIVVIHGDTWMHYPGPAGKAADIMERWLGLLVNGSHTVSAHLLQPDDEPGARRAAQLTQTLEGTPIDTLRFRTWKDIESVFPRQDLRLERCTEPGYGSAPARDSSSPLDTWIAGGIGRVTESAEPTAPAGSVGLAEAARITGYTKHQITGMAENRLLPWTVGPYGRRQFDPEKLLEIVASWRRMAARGIEPPNRLPRQEPAPVAEP